MPNRLDCFGRLQERFGGDTAPVEASPAGALEFDADDAFAKLSGADGGGVTRRAPTDDD
jgi:hypothetical protein